MELLERLLKSAKTTISDQDYNRFAENQIMISFTPKLKDWWRAEFLVR